MTKVNCDILFCVNNLDGVCQLEEINLLDDCGHDYEPIFRCDNEVEKLNTEDHEDE